MNLKDFRAMLLRLDRPEDILKLADKYLAAAADIGADFVLPREHMVVKPILDYYAGDLDGWVNFVKGVRDRLPVDGRSYHAGVQEFYRTLLVRLTQQQRRERLDRAVNKAVKKGMITNSYDDKQRYSRRCTQAWKLRKDNMLKSHVPARGRITTVEREVLLAEFWQIIDAEIDNGELPKP